MVLESAEREPQSLDPHVLAPLAASERAEIEATIVAQGLAVALDTLVERNCASRDGNREVAIRNLRVVEGIARQAGEPDGEFNLDGPDVALAKTADNIPVIAASDLSVEAIRAGIRTSGCLLVKGLVDHDAIAMFRAEIDDAIAGSKADGSDPDELTAAFNLNQPTNGRTVRGRIRRKYDDQQMRLAVDAPHALFTLLEHYRSIGVLDVIRAHLGSDLALAAEKTTLRRVRPEGNLLTGWHQDGAFLEGGARVLNVWLALSDCGVDAPGLEVLPRRLDGVVPGDPAWKDSPMPWIISDYQVAELATETARPCLPTFQAGDALLFDGIFLHRTGRLEGMTQQRYAIESWFFDQATVPELNLPVRV